MPRTILAYCRPPTVGLRYKWVKDTAALLPCLQESDALQSEVKLLQVDRARLSREVSLKQQLEEGWAQRAGHQAAALKEAHAKICTLEKSLQQVRGATVAATRSYLCGSS